MSRNCIIAAAILAAALASSASAATIVHGVNSAATSTQMHGGDRELLSMGFSGSSAIFNGSNFLNFADGSLTNNVGSYGWNAPITRDMGGQSAHSGNPDRADSATLYMGEGSSTGTLREVFGPFASGYRNMSYIIDGEDNGSWFMNLLFAPGMTLSADANDSTVELAVLERGRNSDFNVYGIRADNSLTAPIFVGRGSLASAGWSIDTLEIDGSQQVGGIGISLDSSWTNLAGFRIESQSSFNGPDIVAVGTATPVPAPAGAALLGLGSLIVTRRRRA